MKKSSLLLVAAQLFYSCANQNQTGSLAYEAKKKSERSFTNLDKKQIRRSGNKKISPSERSYPGNDWPEKYVLKNPQYQEPEIADQNDVEIPKIKSSIAEKDQDEDGPVVSGPLEGEVVEGDDIKSEPNNSQTEKYGGYYKIGNPYKIGSVTYYPEKYDNFEEVGLASWYGTEFDGKTTANGEVYHMQDVTAAHRTLPLPSMVKVTNLNNGKSVVVRVNDRGPFARNRVIDVSERAAEHLGFKGKGTTTVKVQFLKNETKELLAKINKEKNEQLQKQGN